MKLGNAVRLLTGVLAAAAIAVSCTSDRQPLAPKPSPDLIGDLTGTLNKVVGSLLTCTPLPFESNSALIGAAGGSLHLGSYSFLVPAGALSRPTWIKAQAPSDTVNSVRFSPEGLQFAKPAALTMSYRNCNLVAGLLTPKRIAYTTDGLRILSYVPTLDNILTRQVTGRIDHFSRYAISY